MLRAGGWESHAWFSPTWADDRLPAVDALAALPKIMRPIPVMEGEEAPQPDGGDESPPAGSVIAGVASDGRGSPSSSAPPPFPRL